MLKPLIDAPRTTKRAVTLIYDTAGICTAFAGALYLRTGQVPPEQVSLSPLLITVIISLLLFIKLGFYRAVLRYMTLPAMLNLLAGLTLSATTLAISCFYFQAWLPRTVPLIYLALALLILGTPRLLMRAWYYHRVRRRKPNVLIYGAGPSGMELCSALTQGNDYHPVAFIDEDPARIGSIRASLRVYSLEQAEQLISRYEPSRLLLASRRQSARQRQTLLEQLKGLPVEILSIPSMEELASGRATISQLQDLAIEDLLGRTPVPPMPELISACIRDQSVMVTGAGGSIGSELCRQIIQQRPKRLVLFELNEYNLYSIERELRTLCESYQHTVELVPALGSVQHRTRLTELMRHFHIDTVYHAAAYKHVPLVEHNVIEGVRNNIFGTWFTAEAAIDAGASHFVLVSTDKAVRPTNVMGASKRVAELVLQALANRQQSTRFCMVRFGNVLGSSGSVVPLFREQIRQGGPVTVTHRDIIRYFMTIPEAAQLVLQAGALSSNGDTFVLDMGEPVRIVELASNMVRLMGLSIRDEQHPDGDIEIHYTGLRPGEKLYEELLVGDNVTGTRHPRIMRAEEEQLSWADTETLLDALDRACRQFEVDHIQQLLQNAPTGFTPDSKISDLLWQQRQQGGSSETGHSENWLH
ncbi:MAG: polysaccharide biosynthesis protein [Marinobacterium sp.]|nr:polysaccharide biosynthesis protein [Marinobacterium sp.]